MNRLETLLENEIEGGEWAIGAKPTHYKRITADEKKRTDLAILGQAKMGAYFGAKLFFSQAVLVGAIVSGDYDKFTIVTPSQYGKSWLLGRMCLILAYEGEPVYIAGASGDVTSIIMGHVVDALVNEAAQEVQNALETDRNRLKRLATSVSKTKISFASGGFVETISLGDVYADDLARNKAVGRAGHYFVDEAALVSDKTIAEMGRRDFARIDGKKFMSVMISNPHRAGSFYDDLVGSDANRHFVMWMDALTAVEEKRFTKEQVLGSDFAKHRSTMKRYLLCELDVDDDAMFPVPAEIQSNGEYKQYFLGVDAAYKGKDKISACLLSVDDSGIARVERITSIKKDNWTDGKTSEDVAKQINRLAKAYSVGMINIDIGYGVWLVEALARRNLPVLGINFGGSPTKARVRARHYSACEASNMRAEMHLDLQNLMEENKIFFSHDAKEQIKDILPYVTSKRKASGKIQIRAKSEIKHLMNGKSPDELDSVLLALHAFITMAGNTYEYIA